MYVYNYIVCESEDRLTFPIDVHIYVYMYFRTLQGVPKHMRARVSGSNPINEVRKEGTTRTAGKVLVHP